MDNKLSLNMALNWIHDPDKSALKISHVISNIGATDRDFEELRDNAMFFIENSNYRFGEGPILKVDDLSDEHKIEFERIIYRFLCGEYEANMQARLTRLALIGLDKAEAKLDFKQLESVTEELESIREENRILREGLKKVIAQSFSWVVAEKTIDCVHTYSAIRNTADRALGGFYYSKGVK